MTQQPNPVSPLRACHCNEDPASTDRQLTPSTRTVKTYQTSRQSTSPTRHLHRCGRRLTNAAACSQTHLADRYPLPDPSTAINQVRVSRDYSQHSVSSHPLDSPGQTSRSPPAQRHASPSSRSCWPSRGRTQLSDPDHQGTRGQSGVRRNGDGRRAAGLTAIVVHRGHPDRAPILKPGQSMRRSERLGRQSSEEMQDGVVLCVLRGQNEPDHPSESVSSPVPLLFLSPPGTDGSYEMAGLTLDRSSSSCPPSMTNHSNMSSLPQMAAHESEVCMFRSGLRMS
jgi:hypothetical protein